MVQFVSASGDQRDEPLRHSVRMMQLRNDSADEATMSIDAVLSTEQPVRMIDWNAREMMDEILLSDGRRACEWLSMLDSHRRSSVVDDNLGHMDSIRTEGTDTVVRCHFDKHDQRGVKAFNKYRDRHVRGLSVGYTVHNYVDIPAGKSHEVNSRKFTAGPTRKLRVCTDWMPDEGSCVIKGADSMALARMATGVRGVSSEITEEEFANLSSEQTAVRSEVAPVLASVEPLTASLSSISQPQVVININGGEPVRSASPVEVTTTTETSDPVRSESSNTALSAEPDESLVDSVVSAMPAEVGGSSRESGRMTTEVADTKPAVDVEKVRSEALAEGIRIEGERRKAIRDLAGTDVSAETLQRCMDDPKIDLVQAQAAFLTDIRANHKAGSRAAEVDSPAPVTGGRGSSSRKQATVGVLSAAITLQMGGEAAVRCLPRMQYDANTGILRMRRATHQITEEERKEHERCVNEAYAFERRAQIDLCIEALRIGQIECPEYSEDIAVRAFSTPTVSTMYTQTMGAILLNNLGEMTDSTTGWCNEQDVKNFKPQELHRLEGGKMSRRIRGEKSRQASFADTMESYRLSEYSNTLIIDRQDLIDDDLNAWQKAMQEYARAIQDLRPSLVYAFLAANAALLTDNVALFHATHANLNASSALSALTLQTAMTALASQRGPGGLNLNLRECVLVTSETLSFVADQLTTSAEIRDNTTNAVFGTSNPLRLRKISTRSDSRLNTGFTNPQTDTAVAAAATTWYLAAAGGAYGINVGYRTGSNRMPTMTTKVLSGGGEFGLTLDVQHDMGVGVEGHQGLVRNTA